MWQLNLLNTDCTDAGSIHRVDDLGKVMNGGPWEYMKSLKAEETIRHLGFSSHDPGIARRILDTGLVDLFMF